MFRSVALAILVLIACAKKPDPTVTPPPPGRCEVDLTATGLFSQKGTGATAQVISSSAQLIGGEAATGRLGDVLLQNDKIRVVIEQPGRTIGPILSGGHIVDADIVRPSGEAGRDGFGRINLMYALGRVTSVTQVEVLSDGSAGGPAIVASTGHDSENDVLDLQSILQNQAGLDVTFVVDAHKPIAMRTTTYYVLSPGETRVRTLTALCNDGTTAPPTPLIDLMDIGTDQLFFPGSCTNGLGAASVDSLSACAVPTPTWVGSQNRGVAYGVRPYSLADPTKPASASAMIGYGGVVAIFVEGQSIDGVLSWTDPNATDRAGSIQVRPGGSRTYLEDFIVGADLAAVSSTVLEGDGIATGHIDVSAPAGAHVTVLDGQGTMQTALVADASGHSAVDLPAGSYQLSAAIEGVLPGPVVPVTVTAGGTQSVPVALAASRTLHVTVADGAGVPSPAKVTVMCNGACAFSQDTWRQYVLIDAPAGGAAAIGYVPVNGQLDLTVPPGQYTVVVTRGPEFSAWPDTWPNAGAAVDLTAGDGSVIA